MREPNTNWFFQPRLASHGSRPDDDDSAPGLIGLPAAMLLRHGARVLDPGTAVAIDGFPPPRSTVYRAKTLLIPGDLHGQAPIDAFNKVLGLIGLNLVPPPAGHGVGAFPRPVVLVPVKDSGKPAEVNAWLALQTLRAATKARKSEERLDKSDVERITLEHLLVGSAIEGSPVGHGGGGLTGGPGGTGGTGPTSTDSYLFNGGDTRTPVAVLFDPPARMTAADCVTAYGRRPVVAVLDTGVRAHPWLDVEPAPDGYTLAPDGFVDIDPGIQDAIRVAGEDAQTQGDRPRQVIRHPWDRPVTAEPMLGELASDTGHSTFISGIVRQLAADACVLAIRVMHGDGAVYEGDLLCALDRLANRVASAQAAGDPAMMVDVVSLSLGYFSETSSDATFTSALWLAIEKLLDLGVIVVAAAGNYCTSRMFYPAAFAQRPPAPGQVPLVSVGALNPNGSKAIFSNGGHWVTAWASGALVVSTLPTDINASRSSELRMRAHPDNPMPPGVSLPAFRAALDPDDYSCGFGIWSGTSFSAPLLAGRIIQSLLAVAMSGMRLDNCDQPATVHRAMAALKDMGWEG
jgi:Subtilase family